MLGPCSAAPRAQPSLRPLRCRGCWVGGGRRAGWCGFPPSSPSPPPLPGSMQVWVFWGVGLAALSSPFECHVTLPLFHAGLLGFVLFGGCVACARLLGRGLPCVLDFHGFLFPQGFSCGCPPCAWKTFVGQGSFAKGLTPRGRQNNARGSAHAATCCSGPALG